MANMSMKKAAFINMLSKYSEVIVNMIFTIILARLLTPSDYGIVSVVSVFTNFFSILASMGIGSAIIQNKSLDKDDENSIFSFSMALAIALAIAFALLSFPIVYFYSDSVYYKLCPLLAVSVFFNTMNMVPNAKLLKEKKFLRVGIRTCVTTLTSCLVAVILAALGAKYYAIIIQSVISAVMTFTWNYWGSGLHLGKIRSESIGKIKSFFTFQFAYDILNYFSRNLDNLLIGQRIGTTELGYYNKGYKLMLYPVNNLTYAITPVLHPILSDYQDEKEYIYQKYIKIVKILSLMGVYITPVLFFCTREIILILYGDQWIGTINLFKALSVSVWFQMIYTTCASIYKSLNHTDIMFKSGLVHITLNVVMIIIGVMTGDVFVVSVMVSAGLTAKFFIEYYFLIHKAFGMSVMKFYINLLPDFLILLIESLVLFILNQIVAVSNIFVSLIIKLAISAVVMVVLLFALRQVKYLMVIIPASLANKIPKKIRAMIK